MYELKLIEEKEGHKIYSNDYYEVGERISKGGVSNLVVNRKTKELSSIYVSEDLRDFKIKGFTISTISWGSLEIEELEEKINIYRIAIETVKELEKMFI